MLAITYDGHPVKIVRVWPIRSFIGEPLLTIRSLQTNKEWEVWEFELKGDCDVIKRNIENLENCQEVRN